MSSLELFLLLLAVPYLFAKVLEFVAVWRINEKLPGGQRLWFSIPRRWTFIGKEYQHLYPQSQLYRVAVSCAWVVLGMAVVFALVQFLSPRVSDRQPI